MEVHDFVQETGIKTTPKKKKCKKAKWLSEDSLQIAEKRREAKGKGKGKLNAVSENNKRDKKACLTEPCREIEENNRMGKTRERLQDFKKTGNIKGTFHARMGMIKDRNSKDLTEAK